MDLDSVEEQRQALEQTLSKLRKGLRHWQVWEAEYEGLKEEILSSPESFTITDISKSYDGEQVNEKEIRDIAGLDSATTRDTQQILGVISRRQEYVQKNIDSLQRQFWDAEAKLEEFDFAFASAWRNSADGTLPLTEIREELDDSDNVISSTLSQPEASTVKFVDNLRKVGITPADLSAGDDVADSSVKSTLPKTSDGELAETQNFEPSTSPSDSTDAINLHRQPVRKKSVSFTADTKPATEPLRVLSEDGTKTVSFAEKVAIAPAAPVPDTRSVSFSPTVEEIPAQISAAPNEESKNLLRNDRPVSQENAPTDKQASADHIVIPENESEGDARTRREMLDYHLNEVGHVVAQIDLDEEDEDGDDALSASDPASSEHLDEDTPYTSDHTDSGDEDEIEDAYGRTTKRVISDAYHKEMLDLQKRLIGNIGPLPSSQDIKDLDPALDPLDVRKLVIRENPEKEIEEGPSVEKKPDLKKRVSFAKDLDVKDADSSPAKQTKPPTQHSASVLSQLKEKHTSPSADTFSSGQVMVEKLKERHPTHQNAAPPSFDEPDPVMQERELASEYYRQRNSMIRQQGGFKAAADPEDDDMELMEEVEGKVKKVSRFKAARFKS